jgi:cell division protein FtsL
MSKLTNNNNLEQVPLLRLRHLAGMVVLVALMVAFPLGIVWKQVYITQTSVRQNRLSDSLAALNKQAAQLRLFVEKLSGTSRIESIARQCLGLDYPTASQIVIMKQSPEKTVTPVAGNSYIAILRRSIARGKG